MFVLLCFSPAAAAAAAAAVGATTWVRAQVCLVLGSGHKLYAEKRLKTKELIDFSGVSQADPRGA